MKRLAALTRMRFPKTTQFAESRLRLSGARRELVTNPNLADGTWSSRRINTFLSGHKGGASQYLEIGVQHGYTLEAVNSPLKVGVDPRPMFNVTKLPDGVTIHAVKSDYFFRNIGREVLFDVIFLDGLHEWFQTYRDLTNALNHMVSGGIVVMDDVIPIDATSAIPSLTESYRQRDLMGSLERRWQGDVYKVVLALIRYHPEIRFRVIDDHAGNSQAVIWLSSSQQTIHKPVASIDEFNSYSYNEIFKDGHVPEFFRLGTESEIMSEAIEASRLRR